MELERTWLIIDVEQGSPCWSRSNLATATVAKAV